MNRTIIGGHYRVIQKLTEGGFGETFIAEDLNSAQPFRCLIKKLKPQSNNPEEVQLARRFFVQETQVLYHLGQHSYIPSLIEHIEENGEFYLIQEYIEGNTLQQEIDSGRIFKEAEVFFMLEELLQILAFVHNQNVIHRDIKPSNIILRASDGKVVLIDFGAVKQVRSKLSFDDSGHTTATVAIGSNGYMANEQLAGHPRYCSDVYGVGMLAIQLLTGKHPASLQMSQQTGEWVWMNHASIRNELAGFIKKMVFYDYRQRFDSALNALHDLKKLKIFYQGVSKEFVRSPKNQNPNINSPQNLPIEAQSNNLIRAQSTDLSQTSFEHPNPNNNNRRTNQPANFKQTRQSQIGKRLKFTDQNNHLLAITSGEVFNKVAVTIGLVLIVPLIFILIGSGLFGMFESSAKYNSTEANETGMLNWLFNYEYVQSEELQALYDDKIKDLEIDHSKILERDFEYWINSDYGLKESFESQNDPERSKRINGDLLREAKRLRNYSISLEKSAKSVADWDIVKFNWIKAKFFFEKVDESHEKYNKAQEGVKYCRKKLIDIMF